MLFHLIILKPCELYFLINSSDVNIKLLPRPRILGCEYKTLERTIFILMCAYNVSEMVWCFFRLVSYRKLNSFLNFFRLNRWAFGSVVFAFCCVLCCECAKFLIRVRNRGGNLARKTPKSGNFFPILVCSEIQISVCFFYFGFTFFLKKI